MRILVVDDEVSIRIMLKRMLRAVPGVELAEAASLDEARQRLAASRFDLALVDIRLGPSATNRDGITLLKEIAEIDRASHPMRSVVVSAFTDGDEVVEAMRHADDYIFKSRLCDELVLPIVKRMREHLGLEREVHGLRARVAVEPSPLGLVGSSPAIERMRHLIRRVALHSDRPVLVIGPTGSGKELVARAIHTHGPNAGEPLLDVNCGAFTTTLITSQLFGHKKNAFTGADRDQDGYLTAVGRGTLFLDEIAELTADAQATLLTALETGRFRPVGSNADQTFQGRIVAATHADLAERVRQGRFREDLYFRLAVLQIDVPSLDERRGDVPALVAHFCRQLRRPLRFTEEAIALLSSMPWPGNVRQLRNLIDRIAVFAEDDVVTPEVIRAIGRPAQAAPAGGAVADGGSLEALAHAALRLPEERKLLDAMQDALVRAAMDLTDGNKSAAARLLGCHRKVVERRLERRAEAEEAD